MSILIVGGDSAIAKNYMSYCDQKNVTYEKTSRRKSNSDSIFLDLSSPDLTVFKKKRYDFVIFFASICNIDFCENNKDYSYNINVTNSLKILFELEKIAKKILFISSNLVFDGTKPRVKVYDETNPTSEYGRHKLKVENAVIDHEKIFILRLSKVIHNNFKLLNEWKENLDNANIIRPFKNMFLSPTPIQDVIENIEKIRLNSNSNSKIYHSVGSDDISYYDFALNLFMNHSNRHLIKKGFAKKGKEISANIFTSLG